MYQVKCVAFTRENEKNIRAIRNIVFIDEQNVPVEMEFDNQDQAAIHVLAMVDNKPVGTGRLLQDGHIGRIAVLKTEREQGIGKKIMQLLIHKAQEEHFPKVYLSAQIQALGFYEKLGFVAYGNEYLEAGIKHLSMEMPLID